MIRRSLRSKLIAIVALGVFLPLAAVAVWTNRSLRSAGEGLLRAQLEAALDGLTREIDKRWELRRGDLMLLSDNDVIRAALRADTLPARSARFLADAFAALQPLVTEVVFRNAQGNPAWRVSLDPAGRALVERALSWQEPDASRDIAVDLRIADSGRGVGTMTALVRLNALMPPTGIAVPGATLEVLEGTRNVSLQIVRSAGDSSLAAHGRGVLTVTRYLSEPPLHFVARARVAPYVAPFAQQARRAAVTLFLLISIAIGLAVMLTSRATRSIRELAVGADEVARGNLDHRVTVDTADEIGRLANSFNMMTRELQRSVRELSHRNALAAVGEFAAELAHEVRNPLTSVRLDLQRAHERADSRLRDPLARALSAVDRLNRTVTGALRVARSGSVTFEPLQLRAALEPALLAAEPAFAARSAHVDRRMEAAASTWLRGDVDALTQLFTNILLNAAEAIEPHGRVEIYASQHNGSVTVTIADSGPGIPAELVPRHDVPFTTKAGGTGLGLTISRRIATAHGGAIEFGNRAGGGTVVSITLPRPRDATGT